VEAVVGLDEGEDVRGEVVTGVEVAEAKAAALQGVEPELDLIEPAGVEGQVVDHQPARMGDTPGVDVRPAVGVQVVEHEVDDLPAGDVCIEQVEEVQEDLLRTSRRDHAHDLAGVDEEPGGQATGAVTDVLDGAPAELAGSSWEQVGESAA